MSNQIYLNQMTFRFRDGREVKGYTIQDNYDSIFVMDDKESDIDLELWDRAKNAVNSVVQDLVQYILDTKSGVTINNNYYDFNDLEGEHDELL